MAYPSGTQHDWRIAGEVPEPGKTMGPLAVVERDYAAIAEKWSTLGPLVDNLGVTTKGITTHPAQEVEELAAKFGVMDSGPARAAGDHLGRADGRRDPGTVGHVERSSGRRGFPGTGEAHRAALVHLAEGSEERRITYADTQARPVPVITSPEWSGSETGGRRYAPFTVNIEELKPSIRLPAGCTSTSTTTGWKNSGEQMPTYRPPLDMSRLFGEPEVGDQKDGIGLTVRYLTRTRNGRSTRSIRTTC